MRVAQAALLLPEQVKPVQPGCAMWNSYGLPFSRLVIQAYLRNSRVVQRNRSRGCRKSATWPPYGKSDAKGRDVDITQLTVDLVDLDHQRIKTTREPPRGETDGSHNVHYVKLCCTEASVIACFRSYGHLSSFPLFRRSTRCSHRDLHGRCRSQSTC